MNRRCNLEKKAKNKQRTDIKKIRKELTNNDFYHKVERAFTIQGHGYLLRKI